MGAARIRNPANYIPDEHFSCHAEHRWIVRSRYSLATGRMPLYTRGLENVRKIMRGERPNLSPSSSGVMGVLPFARNTRNTALTRLVCGVRYEGCLAQWEINVCWIPATRVTSAVCGST